MDLPTDFQTIDIQGVLSIAAYIHYFTPGNLKIRSIVIPLNYKEPGISYTRRWLQEGEAPYPGYCRAPGSGTCLPLLCNCQKLSEIWKKFKETREYLEQNKLQLT